jgi:NADPH:quinone reductase-like Zn-dependent oxidoreductase
MQSLELVHQENDMPQEMTAIRFHDYGGSDKLVVEKVQRPQPKAGEVLIKVHYAGVNPIDWKFRAGFLKEYMPIQLPYTPGIDVSGTIEEVGAGVTGLKKGEAVLGLAQGAYAEYAIAKADAVAAKPDGVSFEVAASVALGSLTAWQSVEDAGIKPGQTVVIQGAAGGVGGFAVQFAHQKGAKVIGTTSTANVDFVKSLGADQVVDYKKGAVEASVKDVDVVIDTVGGDVLEKSFQLLKKGGVLVTIAGMPSQEKAKALGVRALSSGRGSPVHLKGIADLVASKKIKAEPGKVFALKEAGAAQELSQTGHGRGRIVLKV